MATNIPPHNLREITEGVIYALKNPDIKPEDLLSELLKIVKGPDFPTKALIVGRTGMKRLTAQVAAQSLCEQLCRLKRLTSAPVL